MSNLENAGPFSQGVSLDDVVDALSVINITLARLYDVNMALLATTNPEAADAVENAHSQGKFIGVPPRLDDEPYN